MLVTYWFSMKLKGYFLFLLRNALAWHVLIIDDESKYMCGFPLGLLMFTRLKNWSSKSLPKIALLFGAFWVFSTDFFNWLSFSGINQSLFLSCFSKWMSLNYAFLISCNQLTKCTRHSRRHSPWFPAIFKRCHKRLTEVFLMTFPEALLKTQPKVYFEAFPSLKM